MCYSATSSLYTSTVSFLSILYLLSSGIPHFQWLGATLIGWCAMQFTEFLLWSENPREKCTDGNKLLTATAVPLSLFVQAISAILGALFVYKFDFLKPYIIGSVLLSATVIYITQFYKPDKMCTVVTPQGHLDWSRTSNWNAITNTSRDFDYYFWALVIFAPLILWKRSLLFLVVFLLLPAFGFFYGQTTDSGATIWCYYTSWSSAIAAFALFLKQAGIYDLTQVSS